MRSDLSLAVEFGTLKLVDGSLTRASTKSLVVVEFYFNFSCALTPVLNTAVCYASRDF